MLRIDANSCRDHVPFKQPFLVLYTNDTGAQSGDGSWYVDVNGEVSRYVDLERFEKTLPEGLGMREIGLREHDLRETTTPVLKKLARELAENGIFIEAVGLYSGSAGPSHILRNGAVFSREVSLEIPPMSNDGKKIDWMVEPNVST